VQKRNRGKVDYLKGLDRRKTRMNRSTKGRGTGTQTEFVKGDSRLKVATVPNFCEPGIGKESDNEDGENG